MNDQTEIKANLIYEASIQFTGMVEYGVTMEAITSGQFTIPPAGARFDQTFEGNLFGPVIHGTITGTDFLHVRADGSFQFHLHGRITTRVGVNISLFSQGVSLQQEGEVTAQLRSAVSLHTTNEKYNWLNYRQLWAVGTFDPTTGTAEIKAYSV